MFGLGKGQFHLFRECSGKVITADGDVSNPDLLAVCDQQRRVVSTHVEQNGVLFRGDKLIFFAATDSQRVIAMEIVQSQRRDLNDFNFDLRFRERSQCFVNLLGLHGEQTDFCTQHEAAFLDAAAQRLEVPDHIFQGKRNLLSGFVFDDVSHLAALDRRQLDESGQRRVPGKADGNEIPCNIVSRQECFESLLDQFARNRVGLAENFRVRDVVVRHGEHLLGLRSVFQADGF